MHKSKRIKEIIKKVDKTKEYSLEEAIKILKENSKVKFVESLDCAIRLGVDPRHADQMIRGTVSLPHGTGKQVRVLVVAKGSKAQEALDAGADYAGLRIILKKLKAVGQMLMLLLLPRM
jgi:large subunit ribosomal protein L1